MADWLKVRQLGRRRVVNLRSSRTLRVAVGTMLIASLAVIVAGCGGSDGGSDYKIEPSSLKPVEGTDLQQVTLTAQGADRLGLTTSAVAKKGEFKVVPHDSVIYDADGSAYVYKVVKPLVFEREKITIATVKDKQVYLISGPSVGEKVVGVGAAEVYGAELEVDK